MHREIKEENTKQLVDDILEKCYRKTQLNPDQQNHYRDTRKSRGIVFRAMQLGSLTKEILKNFDAQDFAAPKYDGTRYILILGPELGLVVDRNNEISRLQPNVCDLLKQQIKEPILNYCVFDIEALRLKETSSPSPCNDYLISVFDLMMFNANPYTDYPFSKRLSILSNTLLEKTDRGFDLQRLRKEDFCNVLACKRPLLLFKTFYSIASIDRLNELLEKNGFNGCDGFILARRNAPYVDASTNDVVKFKRCNTIDFKIRVSVSSQSPPSFFNKSPHRVYNKYPDENNTLPSPPSPLNNHARIESKTATTPRITIHFIVTGNNQSENIVSILDSETHGEKVVSSWVPLDGKIVECYWDTHKNVPIYVQVRVDKDVPNNQTTFTNTFVSIRENIQVSDVLKQVTSSSIETNTRAPPSSPSKRPFFSLNALPSSSSSCTAESKRIRLNNYSISQ